MRVVLCVIMIFFSMATLTDARPYRLDPVRSVVNFTWQFGPDQIRGVMPVASAELDLDLDRPANSRVTVDVNAADADAGFAFATEAIRGPKVLATNQFPTIRFVSSAVERTETGANLTGNITLRGITRPITFAARFYRQLASEPLDRDHLEIHLTGTILRSEFGADGWAEMVGDAVRLEIIAVIDAEG